jgi:serine/threonine-protein kinase HipA
MQTLCGIAHYDFNMAGAYSYEQAFTVMRRLRLSKAEATQHFRRMVFNVIARNQDDHTKNMAFLMSEDGVWKLSPAYDVIYSHNPSGKWTSRHQMSLNGKRDDFSIQDLFTVGESISLTRTDKVVDEVISAVERWPEYAREAGVNEKTIREISANHRLRMAS